jgi:EAL domain-containing protein (putative c-di-GMP-specific phosphodiesterase class I)
MNQAALRRLILENQLRRVLEREELCLFYQPQIALSTGQLVGMEALLRWQHPESGLLSPSQFVAVAEEMNLIISIGEWVLRTACHQTQAWQAAGLLPIRISINVSSRQFKPVYWLQTIKNVLQESQLAPNYLELELTESVLMEEHNDNNNSIVAVLTELRTMGVQIAIDDFGTGYSSLSYLKRLPVNTLKIDRSFIQDINSNRDDAAIITAIIALAHSLHLSVVAEGVENKEQLTFLQSRQCEIVQGYLLSKPLSQEEMTKLLQRIDQQPLCLLPV